MTDDLRRTMAATLKILERDDLEALALELLDPAEVWAPQALAEAVAEYHRRLHIWASRAARSDDPDLESLRAHRSVGRLALGLLRGDVPKRPARRMPSTKRIAAHHGLPDGECWRCGEAGDVERAHIVDRMQWGDQGCGLDAVQNLALLCFGCHKAMPIVRPDEWERGLAYVGLGRPGTGRRDSR